MGLIGDSHHPSETYPVLYAAIIWSAGFDACKRLLRTGSWRTAV